METSLDRAAGSSPEPAASDVRAELESVLRSPGFERTPRVQRFLRYIAETTLRGDGERLHEHLIAQEVFGRGAEYSPGEDSIVRRQAHALRAKLERFYAAEGADHAIVIELPVGRYMPVFRHRSSAPPSPDAPGPFPGSDGVSSPAAGPAASGRGRLFAPAAAAMAVFALGLAAGYAARTAVERSQQAQRTGTAAAVWGGWMRADRAAVVCFTNRMTASLRHVDEDRTLPDGWYLPESSPGDALFRRAFGLSETGRLNILPEHVMIKVGEAQAAARLASFFGEHRIVMRTLQSRHLTWDLLRRESIVLLGQSDVQQSGISRWVALLLEKRPFQLAAPDKQSPRRIVNTAPLAGEPREFVRDEAPTPGRVDEMVALISMLPGIDPHRELLLINGIDAPATDMAAEFLTNPETVAELAARLRQLAPGKPSPHFQMVLRAEVHEDVPTRATIIALRIL